MVSYTHGDIPNTLNRAQRRKRFYMTNREFYSMIANGYARKTVTDGIEKTVTATADEMKAFALAEIAKLDKRNAKRRETPTKTQTENGVLMGNILAVLANGGKIAADISASVGASTNKVAALLKILADDGKVVTSVISVKGKGKKTFYALPTENDEDETDE